MFGSILFAAGEARQVIFGTIFVLALVVLMIRLLVRLVARLARGSQKKQEEYRG